MARVRQELENRRQNTRCKDSTLYWLQHHTSTRDDHWLQKGTPQLAPFPDKPYFQTILDEFDRSKIIFLPKSREMMISWLIIGYAVHMAQWTPGSFIMIQSAKEDKSIDLVTGRNRPGYVRTLYEQQTPWLKNLHKLTKPPDQMPGDEFTWANGSMIKGFPAGPDFVRQYHPALVIYDEAAFIPAFGASFEAAIPVSSKIIAVSSAAPSEFGDLCRETFELCGLNKPVNTP